MFTFLDVPVATILELYGNFFFEFCQESGYDKILAALGSTTKDFLQVTKIIYNNKLFHYNKLLELNFSFLPSKQYLTQNLKR